MFLLLALGSIIYLAFSYYFVKLSLFALPDLFNSLTRSAYLKVFNVFYEDAEEGEIFPIMTVLQKPTNESFKTIVSFDPRKGV